MQWKNRRSSGRVDLLVCFSLSLKWLLLPKDPLSNLYATVTTPSTRSFHSLVNLSVRASSLVLVLFSSLPSSIRTSYCSSSSNSSAPYSSTTCSLVGMISSSKRFVFDSVFLCVLIFLCFFCFLFFLCVLCFLCFLTLVFLLRSRGSCASGWDSLDCESKSRTRVDVGDEIRADESCNKSSKETQKAEERYIAKG